MLKIKNIELENNVLLAPMAGVTDKAFRLITKPFGPALMYTEMVSGKGLFYNNKRTGDLLTTEDCERPIAVQLFGHEPEVLAEIAYKALESNAEIIDINMGCPAPKIVNNGDGSALMKSPELAGRIIEAVVAAVDKPVTVKFRKGWDNGSVNAVEFAKICEQAGASAIVVHGRTRAQMYAGRADWDIIRDVKRAVGIPVTANGDIFTGADAEHILRYTGCDLAMIGRGSFGNPWLFAQANAAAVGQPEPPLPPLDERMDTAYRQIKALAEFSGERIACLEARHHLPWYLHGVAHSGYYKQQLVHVETLEDVERIIAGIKHDLA